MYSNGNGYSGMPSTETSTQEYISSEVSVTATEQPVGLGIGSPPGAGAMAMNGKGSVSVLVLYSYIHSKLALICLLEGPTYTFEPFA